MSEVGHMLKVTSSGPRPEITPSTAGGRVLNTTAGGSLALEATPSPRRVAARPAAARVARGVGGTRIVSPRSCSGEADVDHCGFGGSQRIPQAGGARKRDPGRPDDRTA